MINTKIARNIKTILLNLIILIGVSFLVLSNSKNEMKQEKIKIEIWSDVVCPFCFIGKKKMDRAVTRLNAEDKVEIIWRSFQLAPDFPKDTSLPSIQYLSYRKGYPIDQINTMCSQLSTQGEDYGIDFNFEKALTFNTLDVHRLIQWAKPLGYSNKLKEAFMIAYFSEGLDLSKEENIYQVIKKVGLNLDKAKSILESDEYTEEVTADINRANQLGIQGVPFFLINEKEVISGAQNDQVFENIITAALKNTKSFAIETEEGYVLQMKEVNKI